MTQTASLKSFQFYPSSYINSVTISVTFLLTMPTGAPAGDLIIVFPTELNIQSASCTECTIVSPNVMLSVSSTTNLTLMINNIVNIGSFKPISNFTVTLTSSNNYLSVVSTKSGWTNTQKSSFITTVTGNNNYRG